MGQTRIECVARRRAVLPVVLLLLGLSGCLSTAGVRAEIEASNRAIVAAQGDALGLAAGEGWEDTVARIDAFIEAHPDEPDTTEPLRLRQAMILAVHAQDALASAAFARIDGARLHTPRDKALLAVSEHLVWWYRVQGTDFDPARGERAHLALVSEADKLGAETDGRALFEDLIALLASEIALQTSNEEKARRYLREGLARFAERFTEAERSVLEAADREVPAGPEGVSMRRRLAILRMPFFVTRYREVAVNSGLTDIAWESPFVKELMDR